MSENTAEVLTGGAVLAVALGFLVYTGQTTGFSARTDGYPLMASFRSADGVSVGTDVRLAGVKVGIVSDMELNPDTYRADTTITVLDGVLVPDDSTLQISSEGLLGGNYLEIVPGGSFDYLPEGGQIYDTQGAVSLITLLAKFVSSDSGGDE